MEDNEILENQGLHGRIETWELEQEMKTSFIAYAMSVIVDRALPDVRDGMKPVHRRILYSMDELGLQPDKPYRKSARIVGDVLGKYHPHGDSSVYGAMVRLAQPFNMRYMLVDGHGNFGSVDGDGAAAMRYTEARMSKLCSEMLADLDKDTVDFYPNFDETLMQPTVLPSRFPNLLVNGSGGIAVGMATNIPPHNMAETIDGLVALIDNPDISVDDLMQYIPGPDFPTGGIIQGRQGIAQAYRTGRGRIIVRARTEIEQYAANRSRIIVTEIPYQVNKAVLVQRIADLVHEKRIEGISDLRDETDRSGMRIVIELKKDVNANVVLNLLFKHTQMQDTFGAIMLALVNGEPRILSLKQMLSYYLDHQKDVVSRRTRFDLNKAKERLHILEGLIVAIDNIDEVVSIIRHSANAQEAKNKLTERFGLSEKQTQAILDMRLQRLTGLERDKIVEEIGQLRERIVYLQGLLDDEGKLLGVIRDEAIAIRDKYRDPRRTEIAQVADDIELDDIIQVEDMIVTMTNNGYIKRTSPSEYRSQNRGGAGVKGQATHSEDFVRTMFSTVTHAPIMFFTNFGRVFKIKCYAIPEGGRNAKGIPVVNLLQLQTGERVTATVPVPRYPDGGYVVMLTKDGTIKKTPIDEFDNIRKTGIKAMNMVEGDELIRAEFSFGQDEFLVSAKSGKCSRFHEDDLRPMGRSATGVRGILLNEGDIAIDLTKVVPGGNVLCVTEKGMGKCTPEDQYPVHKRGGKGVSAMDINEEAGDCLACMTMADPEEDLMLIRDDGIMMRSPVGQISVISRNTKGVRLMRVDEGHRIVSAALVPKEPEETEVSQDAVEASGEQVAETTQAPETEA